MRYDTLHTYYDPSSPFPAGSAVYSQALYKLVASSYLKPSTILSHISPRDKRIRYEEEEKAKISGFPTAKQLREAKETAEARLKREEEEAEAVGLVRDLVSFWCEWVIIVRNRNEKPRTRRAIGRIRYSPFHLPRSALFSFYQQRKTKDEDEVVDVSRTATV